MREREQGARFRWRDSQHTQHDLIQIQILDASKEAGRIRTEVATGFSSCSQAGKELGRRKKHAYYSETPPRFPVWASERGAREGLGHPHTLALTIDYYFRESYAERRRYHSRITGREATNIRSYHVHLRGGLTRAPKRAGNERREKRSSGLALWRLLNRKKKGGGRPPFLPVSCAGFGPPFHFSFSIVSFIVG